MLMGFWLFNPGGNLSARWYNFGIKLSEILTKHYNRTSSQKGMNLKSFLILSIVPIVVMSANVCKLQLTRQICPICAKFIQIRSTLFAQNDSIRIKTACMTLVKANCCSGIRMETETSMRAMGSHDRYASLPFALI